MTMALLSRLGSALAMVLAATSVPAAARSVVVAAPGGSALDLRDSFRVGTSGVVCTAQYRPADPRLVGMFERAYQVTCRDSAAPVASLLALRGSDAGRDIASISSGDGIACGTWQSRSAEAVGTVEAMDCRDRSGLDYRRYRLARGGVTYFAEGLAGYDPALRLGLASLVENRQVEGAMDVVTTLVSDPAAFARLQAGTLDEVSARREAYARNNGGSFAQAAEFFEVLAARGSSGARAAEMLANLGLQQSNLGDHAAAAATFARAEARLTASDGAAERLLRNFRAIDALNRGDSDGVLSALAVTVSAALPDAGRLSEGAITPELAGIINSSNGAVRVVRGGSTGLTPVQRALVLDGQAMQLRGLALIRLGRFDEARVAINEALTLLSRPDLAPITTLGWLKADSYAALATIAERQGDAAGARAAYDQAIALLDADYPATPALLAARAQLAGYLLRSYDAAGAQSLFASVTAESESVPDGSAAIRGLLSPYFKLLADRNDAPANSAMFRASQSLQRPGVAQTQAILARQLSDGSGEASARFRLAVARSRDIVRTGAEIAALEQTAVRSPAEDQRLAGLRDTLTVLSREQAGLTASLAQYPAYRTLAAGALDLGDLQKLLRPGEGYYKMTVSSGRVFGQFITAESAETFALPLSEADLGNKVAALRDSIVTNINGNVVVNPFDLAASRALYKALFGPVADRVAATQHLIFEPDGAMMELPPAVLVTDDRSVEAYARRTARGGDEYDFTGTAWLGRGREISISVGPRSFSDVRQIAPSGGRMGYLGIGSNAAPVGRAQSGSDDNCDWPLATWQNPIDAGELALASGIIGKGGSTVVTGQAFTDDALKAMGNLDQYRIVHFATHGLVTAPRPSCPARPALVTSFGSTDSDGLLSFREVFDLKLDADVVLLSACDTAGMATVAATREAGVAVGGNYALDGLVRAFVGAGARSVVASHWPVPDDFNATKRLIGGLFKAKPGEAVASALVAAETPLMDQADTSHPFYWAAFIVVGDGQRALIPSPR